MASDSGSDWQKRAIRLIFVEQPLVESRSRFQESLAGGISGAFATPYEGVPLDLLLVASLSCAAAKATLQNRPTHPGTKYGELR